MLRRRHFAAALMVGALAVAVSVQPAAAHKLSGKSAEKSAFKVAEREGRAASALLWYAGYCERAGKHSFGCWGAIVGYDFVNDSYYGCVQGIAVNARGHKGKKAKPKAALYGDPYCEALGEEEVQQNSGGGSGSGSSGEWAICGIRSSVCIGS